jgi:hypothetical protein
LAIEPTPVGPILPAWSPDCVELGLWRLKMCSSPLPHSHLAVGDAARAAADQGTEHAELFLGEGGVDFAHLNGYEFC